ncbi:Oidioi.mRNA.OKI2018_I69.chr2.g4733.t1.cds [Oikopleura dioica]|uniref:Mothers against decapentaplegic homolog n=1 Tax=Oikopleura dioica TaxID=34765 RepID=A0ABN7SYP0_OIKDI|nr:Oidioi.mRNA.OKI2018_I69.chr2.g4733.t1.cds [Oikopleura dioica]
MNWFGKPISKEFLAHAIQNPLYPSNTPEYLDKAIKSLIKRLRQSKDPDALQNLRVTLLERNKDTPCVRIPRSLDGRLQVQHRKTLPHLLYVQIWRFPEVTTQHELTSVSNCKFAYIKRLEEVCVNPFHYEKVEKFDSIAPVLVPRYPAENLSINPPQQQIQQQQQHQDRGDYNTQLNQLAQTLSACPKENIAYEERENCYYELSQRLGKQFEITVPHLTIDGFTNPSEADRICLGNISNPTRDAQTKMTRTNIGRGLQLSYQFGEVTIQNVSEASIFVQSPNMNHFFGAHPLTVVKITAGQSATIFNNQSFAAILSDSVNHGFEAVYNLTKMCTMRISFVKGWGSDYRRQHVTSVPCWIELHLNGPLQWLDRVLQQMGSATRKCTSIS